MSRGENIAPTGGRRGYKTIEKEVTEFINSDFDLEADVSSCIDDIFLDTIGVMIAGSGTEIARITANTAMVQMPGEVPLIGGGTSSLYGSTLANAASSYCLDLDPLYDPSTLHVAAILVPLLLTMAAGLKLKKHQVVQAFHSGYNVAAAFGDTFGSAEMYARYFHPTTVAGIFGSAAAAARAFRLNQDQVLDALGLASTMTSGLTSVFDEPFHQSAPFQVANAAFAGMESAYMAKSGAHGPPLFGRKDIFVPFSGMKRPEAESALAARLKESVAELKTSFKRHSACQFLQSAVDAALILREAGEIPKERETVELTVDPLTAELIDSAGDMTHNSQLVLSMAFRFGAVSYDDYSRALKDKWIQDLARRTAVTKGGTLAGHYPDSLPAIVTILGEKGKRAEIRVEHAKGDYRNRLTRQELETKFMKLAGARDRKTVEAVEGLIFGNDQADYSKILPMVSKAVP